MTEMRELKGYEKPIMEVILLEDRDIDTITASSGDGDEWNYDDFNWGPVD